MRSPAERHTEIVAVASGKGGTGKTLMTSCLGYALVRSGHRVLLIDADPGTDGLSLFLLGPRGIKEMTSLENHHTFTGYLDGVEVAPLRINRTEDHGVLYHALISGPNIYGDLDLDDATPALVQTPRAAFRDRVGAMFGDFRANGDFDYVLVDTRGGFAYRTTDVCALSDSFIVVTEADYTSFYQDRNLIRRISAAAEDVGHQPLLRAIVVNKATDGEEQQFRLALEKEFPVRFDHTYPVPLDLDAIRAYKSQQMPYRSVPASDFSYATLTAFADILRVVTGQWPEERIDAWNTLVEEVSDAIAARDSETQKREEERRATAEQVPRLEARIKELELELTYAKREIARLETLYGEERKEWGSPPKVSAPAEAPSTPLRVDMMPRPAAAARAPATSRAYPKLLAAALAVVVIGTGSYLGVDALRQPSPRERLASLGVDYTVSSFLDAVQAGDRLVVPLFLEAGMSPTVSDSRGRAVQLAARSGSVEILQTLQGEGALVDADVLLEAVAADQPDVVRYLLSDVLTRDQVESEAAQTALAVAASQGHREIERMLRGAGVPEPARRILP